ncbi:MAG TPA: sulfotransferase [Caulobacteraceae bacterium]|nr:sulfotransferase [Caulobacteraceae bacterium]
MEFEEYFRRGGQLEAAGRYDEAFAAYAEANRLQRQPEAAAAYEAQEVEALEAALALLPGQVLGQLMGGGERTRAPIFMVGMPRSGLSLVEGTLAAHEQVTSLGETPLLETVARGKFPMNRRAPFPPGHFKTLGGEFLAGARKAGWRGVGRFTNRHLGNIWYLGVARAMFPNSTVVHVTRDPIDTCLAIWVMQFGKNAPLANDLGDIGRQYVRYRTLVDHWVKNLPGKMLHLKYEGLVERPEASIRDLLQAADLTWSDSCLRWFDSQRGTVTGAGQAAMQNEVVGRWRRFEKHLGPLLEALGPYVTEVVT